MSKRGTYKVYPILVKTHKLTLLLEAPPDKTVEELKQDVLSALSSKVVNVDDEPEDAPFEVQETKDIELCRELKEKQGRTLVPIGKFEALDESTPVMKQTLPYEHIFIRYQKNGQRINPIYSPLPIAADEEEDPLADTPTDKGKGKV